MCHIKPVKQTKHPKKNTKKIQEQKLFNKGQSVFKDWRDSQDVVRKQWAYDMERTKINRFVKDEMALQ